MVIPEELFKEFRKHRQRLKAPMTEYAERLILLKLERLQAEGHDPVAIVNTSIEYGWKGVFAPKDEQGKALQWWQTDQGVLAKGAELGLSARPGETLPQFKGRIQARIGH